MILWLAVSPSLCHPLCVTLSVSPSLCRSHPLAVEELEELVTEALTGVKGSRLSLEYKVLSLSQTWPSHLPNMPHTLVSTSVSVFLLLNRYLCSLSIHLPLSDSATQFSQISATFIGGEAQKQIQKRSSQYAHTSTDTTDSFLIHMAACMPHI